MTAKKQRSLTILSLILFTYTYCTAQVCNYADEILDYSTQWSTSSWNANEALGEYDTYPNYGDISTAWASATQSGQREYLELRFDNPTPIDSIYVYETYNSGAIDTIYVKNPIINNWEVVYTATPTSITNSRILKVGFPLTNYNVAEVRLAIDSPAVPGWNEIDAVAINSVTADAGDDKTLDCNVTSVTLEGNCTTTNGAVYQWTTPTGNIISGANTKAAIVGAAGIYTLSVTKYGITITDTVTVNYSPLAPNIDIIADISDCNSIILPTITGVNLSGSEQYYTGANGTGTTYASGAVINYTDFTFYPATLYAYDTVGICTDEQAFTITVNPLQTPLFTAIPDICEGDSLVALPTTSTNGIVGTWSPALNNTSTTTYNFTPNAGQCASTTTLTITVNPLQTPLFTAIPDICEGDSLAALPTTSTNGIVGTWSPAMNNTSTTTYNFIPDAGQCASTTMLTITVNSTPILTVPQSVSLCDTTYILPSLPVGNYYTETNGLGVQLSAGTTINTSQTIYVNATNGLCTVNDSFQVVISTTPIIDTLENVIASESYTLPYLQNGAYFTQPDGLGIPLLGGDVISESQIIYIYATNNNCEQQSSFTVTIIHTNYPSFFSPNGDGINDYWQVYNNNILQKSILFIYDRYGKVVAQLKPNSKWDGKYNGNPLPATDYWFKIQLKDGNYLKGHFSLLR